MEKVLCCLRGISLYSKYCVRLWKLFYAVKTILGHSITLGALALAEGWAVQSPKGILDLTIGPIEYIYL